MKNFNTAILPKIIQLPNSRKHWNSKLKKKMKNNNFTIRGFCTLFCNFYTINLKVCFFLISNFFFDFVYREFPYLEPNMSISFIFAKRLQLKLPPPPPFSITDNLWLGNPIDIFFRNDYFLSNKPNIAQLHSHSAR